MLNWSVIVVDHLSNNLVNITMMIRACLDQLLIAVRSFTVLCDQSRSWSRSWS